MYTNKELYFSQLEEYNGLMIGNQSAVRYTQKQVMVQSLLLNHFVTGNTWYVDLVKSIAYYGRPLSAKQEAVLDKLIANVTNGSIQPATAPAPLPTLTNHAALFDFLRAATKHLQRPHVWIPLDLSKPITKSCDVIKVTFKPATPALSYRSASPEQLDLVVRVQGNQNTYAGHIDASGVIHIRDRIWVFRKGHTTVDIILNTLGVLASDPATNTSKWGKLLSRCCYCWLPLSTPESLFAGYGDVCAKHYGLPWGKGFGVLTQTQVLANAAHMMNHQ